MKGIKLKVLAYYASQYAWTLYIILPLLYSYFVPTRTDKITIISYSNSKFDSSKNPQIFAHVSDIHMSTYKPHGVANFREAIKILKNVNPDFVLITGDLADNYDTAKRYPHYGDQIENDWKIYQNEISNLSIPIIDLGGNHDLFGVEGYSTARNFIRDYSVSIKSQNVKNVNDFRVHSHKIGDQNVIVVNPFDFPSAHPPLLFFETVTTEMLDKIESEILKNPKSIVACHYPTSMLHSKLSSSNKKFSDIIGSTDVLAYLTGHTHPSEAKVSHYGIGGIEVVCPSLISQKKFGIVTIDNSAFSWSTIDLDNPAKGVISYPQPKQQINRHVNFNESNTEIRVIMFSDKTDLSISIEGSVNGKMTFSRHLPNGLSLYTYPLNLPQGNHQITFTGDFEGTREFIINDVFNTGNEVIPFPMKLCQFIFMILPLLWLFLIIITFVFPCEFFHMFEGIEQWIETSTNENHWVFAIFFGFFLMRVRFQRLPKMLRRIVFIAVLSPILLPSMFFECENAFGLVTLYGYYSGGKHHSADFGTFYAYMYLAFVCLPMVVMCSSFGVKEWSYAQIGDIIFTAICAVIEMFILVRLVYESAGPLYMLCSPMFVIIPMIFIVIFALWRICSCKKSSSDYEIAESSMSERLTSMPEVVIS